MEEQAALRVHMELSRPVELTDLTLSLLGLGDEYRDFVERHPEICTKAGAKLYVRKIKSGSIITDLVAMIPGALPFVEHANTVIQFAGHLKIVLDYLLQRTDAKPELGRRNLENALKVLEPVAKDPSGGIQIIAMPESTVIVNLNSTEANAIQNRARRELEALQEPKVGLHRKVLMYWYQARNDPTSRAGDRAIIESISPRPVKVVFEDDQLKGTILADQENIFRFGYVVDVAVETVQGVPTLYRVLAIHDKVPLS